MSCVPQATTTVYVTILDENDNAPAFRQQLYEVTLDEGPSTLNATLVTVQALDQDEGPNGTVAYAITEGNILGTFHIDNATVSTDVSPIPDVSLSCSLHSQLLSPVLAGGDPHSEGAGLRDQPRALHLDRHRHRPVPHHLAPADVDHHSKELMGELRHCGLFGVEEFLLCEQFHISFPWSPVAFPSCGRFAQLLSLCSLRGVSKQGRAQWTLMGYLAQLLGPAKTERIPGTPFKLRYVFLRWPLGPCLKGQQVVRHCYSINFSFIFIFCGYLCAFNIPFSLLVRRLFNAFSHFYVTFLCSSFCSPWATVT